MKKYRLTDQKTVLGILLKLVNKVLTDPVEKQKFQITDPTAVNDILKSVHITVTSTEPIKKKPLSLTCLLKDNRVEIRIKQVNPYLDDLFHATEILIEPLERSAKRTALDSINAKEIKIAPKIDIITILSLYGKTSIINQALTSWQDHIEHLLSSYNYFIKKVNIGFYYAADTPLLEALSTAKIPYYLQDSNKKKFYSERGFFSPSKLNENYVRTLLDNHLVNNVKSVLIFPIFSIDKFLLGYFEIISNLPDLGNNALQNEIDGPEGISPLLAFLEARADEFVFHLEFSYAKDWDIVAHQCLIRDLSEDGRGIGIYIKEASALEGRAIGSPISFQIEINSLVYTFFGTLRSIKKPNAENEDHSIGIHIFQCDRPEGLSLLGGYASQLIGHEII